MATRNLGRKLADYLFLMVHIKRALGHPLPAGPISHTTAAALYKEAVSKMDVPIASLLTPCGRKRRSSQLGWGWSAILARKAAQAARLAAADS